MVFEQGRAAVDELAPAPPDAPAPSKGRAVTMAIYGSLALAVLLLIAALVWRFLL